MRCLAARSVSSPLPTMAARPTPCMGGNRRPGSLRAADLPGQRVSDLTAAAGTLNRANRTIRTGHKLDVICGMNSGCIDLICLDPPLQLEGGLRSAGRKQGGRRRLQRQVDSGRLDVAWPDLIEAKHPRLNRFIRAAMTGATRRALSAGLPACSRCAGCSSRQARSTFTAARDS